MTMIMMTYGDDNDVDVLMYVSNDHGYDGDNINVKSSHLHHQCCYML